MLARTKGQLISLNRIMRGVNDSRKDPLESRFCALSRSR